MPCDWGYIVLVISGERTASGFMFQGMSCSVLSTDCSPFVSIVLLFQLKVDIRCVL